MFHLIKQEGSADDTRIQSSISSIEYVLDHGGSLILMSHLGRPKGQRTSEFSLAPCAKALADLINRPVQMAPDCIGKEVEDRVRKLRPGEIILLENLRFHQGEEHPDKDPDFAKQLAKLGDAYVNDAFGTAHRAHASTYIVPQLFPHQAAAGFLMEKEIDFLGQLIFPHSAKAFLRCHWRSQDFNKTRCSEGFTEESRRAFDRRRHDLYIYEGPRTFNR